MTVTDTAALRNALATFTTGITVVTTLDGNSNPVGLTANSFSSVSLAPPLVAWCIGQDSQQYETFCKTKNFVIHMLDATQTEVSQLFSGPEPDKFGQVNWHPGAGGVPILDTCISHFECQIEHRYPGGDHLILVGRVTEFCHRDSDPLVFFKGQYRSLD